MVLENEIIHENDLNDKKLEADILLNLDLNDDNRVLFKGHLRPNDSKDFSN